MGLVVAAVVLGGLALWALGQGKKKPVTLWVYPGEIWTVGYILPKAMTAEDWTVFMAGQEDVANVMGVTQGGPSHYSITLEYLAPTEILGPGQTVETEWGDITVAYAQRAPAGR